MGRSKDRCATGSMAKESRGRTNVWVSIYMSCGAVAFGGARTGMMDRLWGIEGHRLAAMGTMGMKLKMGPTEG